MLNKHTKTNKQIVVLFTWAWFCWYGCVLCLCCVFFVKLNILSTFSVWVLCYWALLGCLFQPVKLFLELSWIYCALKWCCDQQPGKVFGWCPRNKVVSPIQQHLTSILRSSVLMFTSRKVQQAGVQPCLVGDMSPCSLTLMCSDSTRCKPQPTLNRYHKNYFTFNFEEQCFGPCG